MITISDREGQLIALNPSMIETVYEAGTSLQWHGTRSIITLISGRTIECQQHANEVVELIKDN